MNKPRWHCFPDAAAVAAAAARLIQQQAQQAIRARGTFRIVLAGGTTPKHTYALLAESAQDWTRWEIFFGDERCLPADDPERNSAMAASVWLDKVAIPPAQIHPIPAELGAPTAARAYAQTLGDTPYFDLVLLGMGEDGHTASLFPGQQHPQDARVVAVADAPKPPPQRVSLNSATLGACACLLMLVTGSGKREAVKAWRAGADLPIARIRSQGEHHVFVDAAAWVNSPA